LLNCASAGLGSRIGRIRTYRPDSWSAASLGVQDISCTEFPHVLSTFRRNSVRCSYRKRCHLSTRSDHKNAVGICQSD
jgi:hypothetical protein